MAPAAEEWSEGYVLRKENKSKPYTPALECPLDTVGTASDTWRCLHCDCRGISAQPQRIRAHIAGLKGHGVNVCKGPPAKTR
jgi:hypothetical protein